jgi:hypothetical protein
VTVEEINEMVGSSKFKPFFKPKDPLHQALLRGVGCHHLGNILFIFIILSELYV